MALRRSIAIFRALQLGDMLCAIPAIRSLRAGYPQAEITLVGLPWAASFARTFPDYFDGFLPFPGWPGLPEGQSTPAARTAFVNEARCRRFDLAVQLHGSGALTNPIVAAFEAAEMLAFTPPGQFRPAGGTFVDYPETGPEIHRLLSLTRAAGMPDRGDSLEFPVSASDESAAAALLRSIGISGGYAIVHPGASIAARRWPPEAFAAVARRLQAEGLAVLVTGTSAESTIVAAVQRGAPGVHSLAGMTQLGTLAALLGRARVVVANDTGVSHLAAATRAPSVVLFTGSEMERWAPLDRERHRPLHATAGAWSPPHEPEVEAVIEQAAHLLSGELVHASA